ncbi:MAG: EamA-like transporter family protein [Candidatus Cloacimonetes bacterium ADurb.Bin088]|jgi:drug/metabolite transporter (DMT)-like permease|nr:MAG: EamA-like transporter family protein [Candidatus Cloacimonetes bacterium ADurb.Bin088]
MMLIRNGKILSYLNLTLTAAIWGFAFVAQRSGLESLDPFTFNALRFALGTLCVWLVRKVARPGDAPARTDCDTTFTRKGIRQLLLLGLLLFCASSLQQTGMLWTSAGSAGFITGLYVVFVPLISLLRGRKLSKALLVSIPLAVMGLWLLNMNVGLNANLGNGLVLLGAVFWALHIQLIDRLTQLHSSLDIAVAQYAVCALLSALVAFPVSRAVPAWNMNLAELLQGISQAAVPILYAGVLSVGVAFTLQLHAQKKAAPEVASVILCLEGVFAMLGGYLILGEEVSLMAATGAVLLLAAMLATILGEGRGHFLIDKKGKPKF